MLHAEPCLGTIQDVVDAMVHHNRDDTPLDLVGTSNVLLLVLRSAS